MSSKTQKLLMMKATILLLGILLILGMTLPLLSLLTKGNASVMFYRLLSVGFINILVVFYVSQLTLACHAVRKRFQTLNEHLKSSISSERFKLASGKDSNILNLGDFFHSLCNAIEIINSTFTFHLILLMHNILVRRWFLLWFPMMINFKSFIFS